MLSIKKAILSNNFYTKNILSDSQIIVKCTLKKYDIYQIIKLNKRITKCKNSYNSKRMRKPKSHVLFSRTSLPSVSTYFSWFSRFLNLFSFFHGFLSLLLFKLSMLTPDFGVIPKQFNLTIISIRSPFQEHDRLMYIPNQHNYT